MLIRDAILQDCEVINAIYNQAVVAKQTGDTIPIILEDRRKWLEQHQRSGYPVFVAEIDDTVVGWLSFSAYRAGRMAFRHTAEISYYIDRRYHRRGIGSALVKHSIKACPLLSFQNLIAIILENNLASIQLLESAGFKQWGHLPSVATFDGERCGHVYYGINLA